MKRSPLKFALLCLTVLTFGVGWTEVQADGLISIDHVKGQFRNDSVLVAQPIRMVIRFNNNTGRKCDIANGWRLTSPDGATWDSTTIISVNPSFQSLFSVIYKLRKFSATGQPPDTVGMLGAGDPTDPTTQMPAGYSDTVIAITAWFHDNTAAGKHVCIDTSFYQPGGTWLWVDDTLGNHYPTFQGLPGQIYNPGVDADRNGAGYCFYIYDSTAKPANLVVTPNPMTFTAQEGGADPTPQKLFISSSTATVLNYNLNWYLNFITTDKMSGSTPDSVLVSPKVAGLTAGSYRDSIQVASPTAPNSPLYIPVIFNVTARPKVLKLTPDTLFFAATANGANPPSQQFGVAETGGASIPYIASTLAPWISLPTPSGSTPANVTVNVLISGIPAGTYFDSIVVASGSASNSPVWEFVHLTLTPPEVKTLVTTPDTLFFNAQESSANPPGQYFHVSEASNKVIPYAVSIHAAYLSTDKASGNTPDSVKVMVDITSKAAGIYTDTIQVTSSDSAVSNQRRVFVITNITACPVLLASKTAYYDTVYTNQPVVIADSINITSSGSPIPWSAANISTGFVLPVMFGTTPSVVPFTFNQSYGAMGNYSSCFTISSSTLSANRKARFVRQVAAPQACSSSVQICVNVTVLARPCVALLQSDTVFSFTAPEGGAPTPSALAYAAHVSDSSQAVSFKITRPNTDTWVKFVRGTDTLTEVDAINFASVNIIVDPTGLTPGNYVASCTTVSTDSTVCQPRSIFFTVLFNVTRPPSSDTLLVANVPGVPGAQVPVPISFVNSCPLVDIGASLMWDKTNLHLDSVSYVGSRFTGGTNQAQVDNVNGKVVLTSTATPGNPTIPSGSGLLANLYFSIAPLASAGAYQLTPVDSLSIYEHRKCTDSITVDYPQYIKGGIVTDTASDFICGWVVDTAGNQIPGATVQMFGVFPQGSPVMTTTSTGIGSFAFTGEHPTPFDLYAYHEGYYPGVVTKLNFGAKGVKIVLTPLRSLTPTSEWVDYFCTSNNLFGAPMPIGSVVEAMDGNFLVGRWVVTEVGKYGFMPVYRANDQFGDNGAKTDDVITFFVNELPAVATGNTTYPSAYAQEEVCLDAGATITKTCELQSGWNLISWNVDTPNDSITAVLNSISSCVDVVLGFEGGGLTYDPTLPQFSTLWFTDHLSGYWVKIKPDCSATLSVTGIPVNPSTPIPVYSGWNLVSYLPDNNLTPDSGFASVLSNLFVAYGYNNGVQVFKPGQAQFNTLTQLGPCNGYWLKMNTDGSLVYPGSAPVTVAAENPRAKAARLAAATGIKPTTSWMNLYSRNLTLDGKPVASGAVINAVSPSGVKIGGFTMKQAGVFGFMPVYSDAGSSDAVTGLKAGDKFTLTVNGTQTQESFVWTSNGDRLEVAKLTSANGGGTLPTSYSLAQNYPNPFNPSTTIKFALPVAGNARLEVYNVLGALVAVPFDGMAEAGDHQVVWDGKNSHGQQVASGVYFYRLSAGTYTETKKMMLLK